MVQSLFQQPLRFVQHPFRKATLPLDQERPQPVFPASAVFRQGIQVPSLARRLPKMPVRQCNCRKNLQGTRLHLPVTQAACQDQRLLGSERRVLQPSLFLGVARQRHQKKALLEVVLLLPGNPQPFLVGLQGRGQISEVAPRRAQQVQGVRQGRSLADFSTQAKRFLRRACCTIVPISDGFDLGQGAEGDGQAGSIRRLAEEHHRLLRRSDRVVEPPDFLQGQPDVRQSHSHAALVPELSPGLKGLPVKLQGLFGSVQGDVHRSQVGSHVDHLPEIPRGFQMLECLREVRDGLIELPHAGVGCADEILGPPDPQMVPQRIENSQGGPCAPDRQIQVPLEEVPIGDRSRDLSFLLSVLQSSGDFQSTVQVILHFRVVGGAGVQSGNLVEKSHAARRGFAARQKVERLLVELQRWSMSEETCALVASLFRILQSLGPCAPLDEVVGQLLQGLLRIGTVGLLQEVPGQQMQSSALRTEAAIDQIAGPDVGEADPLLTPLLDAAEQAPVAKRKEIGCHPARIPSACLSEQPAGGGSIEHGEDPHQATLALGEAREPTMEGLVDAAGHLQPIQMDKIDLPLPVAPGDSPILGQCPQNLFDEEGIPRRVTLEDQGQFRRLLLQRHHGADQLAYFQCFKSLEPQDHLHGGQRCLGSQRLKRPSLHLVIAVGSHQEIGSARGPVPEVSQQLHGQVVRPVKILQSEHKRAPVALLSEHLLGRLEKARLRLAGTDTLRFRLRVRDEIGNEGSQNGGLQTLDLAGFGVSQ